MDVRIELDKPRTLRFDLVSINDLEAQYGKPLGHIVNDIAALSITAIKLSLLHGLSHEDRSLTPSLVLKILQSGLREQRLTLDVVVRKLRYALDESGMFRTEDDATVGNVQAEPVAEN